MKKYDFSPSTAQWRAKKLRERGSNTARPTEKGIGGLPIGACPVDFGAYVVSIRSISARRFGVLLVSRFGRFGRVDSVVSRFGRVGRVGRVASKSRRKHKKSPIPQSGNRAVAIARRRALLTFG